MMQKLLKQAGGLVSLCVLICCPVENSYAQDEQATEILHLMSAEIASLDSYVITGDGYADDRLDAGQIIEHTMDVTIRMNRRDQAMRITNRDDFGAGEYHLMIRQGKTMRFTGTIGLGPRAGEPWPDDWSG